MKIANRESLTRGAHEGIRTPDPRLKRALLYQLSYMRIWCTRQDLNLWSHGYQPCALTNYATSAYLVVPFGFEPKSDGL